MIETDGRNLIFILSSPRAGSTLLGAVLGTHSRLLCPPEPWLLLPLQAMLSDRAAIIASYDHQFAQQAWKELMVDDRLPNAATTAFANKIYNELLEQSQKEFFVDKTPRYYHILPWIEQLFPSAHKIWLKRNPLDVIASCKATWGLTVEELLGGVLSPHSFDTTVSFALLADFFHGSLPNRVELRYEELVRDPEAIIHGLCDSLGIQFEPTMLQYGQNAGLMATYAQRTMGDKKVLEHDRPHNHSLNRWRDLLTPEETRRVLTSLGTRLFDLMGYDSEMREAALECGLDLAQVTPDGRLPSLLEARNRYADSQLTTSAAGRRTLIARENARIYSLLRESEADRAARLRVIEEIGRQLTESEADRAARLTVIEEQGHRLAEMDTEMNDLRGELNGLRAQMSSLEQQFKRLSQERDDLRDSREQLSSAFDALRKSKVYRLMRRTGRWGALEQMTLGSTPGSHGLLALPKDGQAVGSDSASSALQELKCVAVDLTPVLPSGENGGAKLVAVSLVQQLSRLVPECEFVLLTSDKSHDELAFLDSSNVRRICVVRQSAVQAAVTPTLRSIRVRVQGQLARILPGGVLQRLRGSYLSARHRPRGSGLLREIGADLLFCPFTMPSYYDPAVPTVSLVHDIQYAYYPEFFSAEERYHRDWCFKEACRVADRVICVSEHVRQTVIEKGKVEPSRVVAVPTGLLEQRREQDREQMLQVLEELRLAEGSFLLYPANFWAHKNHRMLFTAFGIYRSHNRNSALKLVCTGTDSDQAKELKEVVRRMGMAESIVFAGYLADEEFASLLQSCKAVIFPSLYEGFGMPVLEAMAFSKPVLCSSTTSLPEVAGNAALYFDPRKPREISDAIERIATDHDLVAMLVEAGRQRLSRFDGSERMARQYLETFLSVLDSPRRLTDGLHGVHADRWVGDHISVTYAPSQEPRRLEVTLEVPTWLPKEHVTVREAATSGSSDTYVIPRGGATTIQRQLTASGGILELTVEPTFSPRQLGMNDDDRYIACTCTSCLIVSSRGAHDLLLTEVAE